MTVDWDSCPSATATASQTVNMRVERRGTAPTHLAKRTREFLVQRSQPQRTHVARPMVARGQGIVLDGLGAYPANGRRAVLVVVRRGICGGSVDVGRGIVGGQRRCGCVRSGRGLIATALGGSGGVGSAATTTATATASSVTVLRWGSSSFGGRHGFGAEHCGRVSWKEVPRDPLPSTTPTASPPISRRI
jgi:hypothetical protein